MTATPPPRLAPASRLAVALCWAALAAGCGPNERPLPKDVPTPVAARVMVLAGDTLIVDGVHIALANVVTPQSIPSARCWAEAMSAKSAVQLVKRLVRDAQTIRVQPTGKFDGYGRTIAHVTLDGLDLGQTLYDSGAAAKPADGVFRWCEAVSFELDGPPTWASLNEPGR